MFANDLHISSGNDSGDEAAALPQTPGVVRRPVVRRGNMLVNAGTEFEVIVMLILAAKITTIRSHQG
jgi:hypothetical protein